LEKNGITRQLGKNEITRQLGKRNLKRENNIKFISKVMRGKWNGFIWLSSGLM
jgi:hypothetical protein